MPSFLPPHPQHFVRVSSRVEMAAGGFVYSSVVGSVLCSGAGIDGGNGDVKPI